MLPGAEPPGDGEGATGPGWAPGAGAGGGPGLKPVVGGIPRAAAVRIGRACGAEAVNAASDPVESMVRKINDMRQQLVNAWPFSSERLVFR